MFTITDTQLGIDIALVPANEIAAFLRAYGEPAGLAISPAQR